MIYHYSESCYNDEEFEFARQGKNRIDISFFTTAKSKAEAIRKFIKTPSIGDSSIRWVRQRVGESGNEQIAKIIQDDAIYAFEQNTSVLLGRYNAETYGWIPQHDFHEKRRQWFEFVEQAQKNSEKKDAAKGKAVSETFVIEKVWDTDDTYLQVETQVFSEDGFQAGDKVRVTVERINSDITS